MKKNKLLQVLIIGGIIFCFANCNKPDPDPLTVTDIDGNVYHIVKICDQLWMSENLKVTRFRNGDVIPYVSKIEWDSVLFSPYHDPAYCNLSDLNQNGNIYGHLYNWQAAIDPRGLAPSGWHIPSETEFNQLIECIGGEYAGGKLKETGFSHWVSPNTGATDLYGFTALPAEFRNYYSDENDPDSFLALWSSSSPPECNGTHAKFLQLVYNNQSVKLYCEFKSFGQSVRCVKD